MRHSAQWSSPCPLWRASISIKCERKLDQEIHRLIEGGEGEGDELLIRLPGADPPPMAAEPFEFDG
jgi:hypothetical protein